MKQFILAGLAPLVAAHWELVYPAQRAEGNEDTMPQFPCGGVNAVSSNRTLFPINGAPIQMNMGHTEYNVQVLMALGNDPGSAFNYVLVPTFTEEGPDNFCIGAGAITFPEGLNVTDGTNATIQVVTNGDSGGGLYNCADVTFTSTPLTTEEYGSNCQNSTGVEVRALSGEARNANETSSGHSHGGDDDDDDDSTSTTNSTSTSASAGTSATGSAATTTSAGLAAQATLASWGLAAAGVAAGFMAL
ncbi:hypothetical protein CAC42_2104 [Sphaceloma murrayae]|uniref:Copper acquisition factor BIM1-like domain-containing protein n=1 Tax=Sphaceloma murrayae TaxID=2082308 RepID=A0A2K1QI79_9PEZI|nr:hypothetical protein CAC42_2104 [Sphaceloma murrayae]